MLSRQDLLCEGCCFLDFREQLSGFDVHSTGKGYELHNV